MVDAITGEFFEYTLEDVISNPELQWVDGIYSKELLIEQ